MKKKKPNMQVHVLHVSVNVMQQKDVHIVSSHKFPILTLIGLPGKYEQHKSKTNEMLHITVQLTSSCLSASNFFHDSTLSSR